MVHRVFSRLFIEVDKGNYDYLFDMMYPKFYEIIPRDVTQTAMEQALNSDEMELKLYDSHIEEVKSMQELNGVKYFRINYSTTMSRRCQSPQTGMMLNWTEMLSSSLH
ncbi:MAG: hypothetical protein NXI00_18775 [Cytophagales bacterium]|nr:hypothetical protein [Cytophagales bacterium]